MQRRRSNKSSCFICRSAEVNELELGEFHQEGKIAVHYFCLLLTSGLEQNGDDDQGIFGFLPKDIRSEVERCKRLKCIYCKEIGANIGCCAPKCRHTFHTTCGLQSGSLMQFEDPYRSFCHRHAATVVCPKSRKVRHKTTEMCSICHDAMGEFDLVQSVQSPCCKRSWFHKRCLMEFAKTAGYFFKCPMCNNEDEFRSAVKLRGVFVPDRDAAWELEPNAFAELLERPESCEASKCVCPNGREYENSTYKMLRCETCGSHCIHNKCLPGANGRVFECNDCALPRISANAGVDAWNGESTMNTLDQSNAADDKLERDISNDKDETDSESTISNYQSVEQSETDDDVHIENDFARSVNSAARNIGKLKRNRRSKDDSLSLRPSVANPEVLARGAPVKANNSFNDVLFVETKDDPIDISSDDDAENDIVHRIAQGNQPVRPHPELVANIGQQSVQNSRSAIKRERSCLDEADCKAESASMPPQSKRIRRALQTMKAQSKITSFFCVLGSSLKRTEIASTSNGTRQMQHINTTSNGIPPTGARIKAEPLK